MAVKYIADTHFGHDHTWMKNCRLGDYFESVNVHGHIHNNVDCDGYRLIKEYLPCALNAGFDINDHPVTFEELLKNNENWYGRKRVLK